MHAQQSITTGQQSFWAHPNTRKQWEIKQENADEETQGKRGKESIKL